MIESLPNNYTVLEERDGSQVLLDEAKYNVLCGRLTEMEGIYTQIKEMLVQYDYPVRREWIHAIVDEGAEGFKKVIVQDTDADAKRLRVSVRIAEQWRRTVIQEVPTEVWEKCESFRSSAVSLSQGLPRLYHGFTEQRGLFLDKVTAKRDIREACSCVVTEQMKKEADEIVNIANDVRRMEFHGLNAVELIRKYVPGDEAPDLLTRYRDVATRRHAKGNLTPTNTDIFLNISH